MTRPLFWAGSVFLLTGAAFCTLDVTAALFVSAIGVACVVWFSGLNRLRQFAVLIFCWLAAIGYCWVWPVWFAARLSRFTNEPLPAAVTVTKVEMQGRQYRYTGRAAFYTIDKSPSTDIVLTSFVDLGVLPGEQTACIGSLSFGATLRELAASKPVFRYESTAVAPSKSFHPILARMAFWRTKLAGRAWQLAGAGFSGGLTAALLTGDTSRLSDENLRLLRRAGLAHLVVVSGLHLSIMALLLSRLLRRAPGVLRIGLVILFCWAFALLTGFGASVVRAAVMLTVHETAALFSRRSDGPTALALAGIFLVAGDLRMAGSVSFWLSFLSTAGILFLFVPLTGSSLRDGGELSLKARVLSGVKTGAAVSASAQLGALPVLATTFKTLSPMGIAANIPCVFLSMVMLPLGWLAIGVSVWLPGMGMAAGYVLKLCAELILFFARFVSYLPFSSVGINERYMLCGIWFLWLGGFALVVKKAKRRLGVVMMRRLAVCLLLPAVVSYPVFWLFSKNTAEVVFFPDFGAVAVQNADRLVLLGAPSTLREAARMADVLEQLGMTVPETVIILHGQFADAPLDALVSRLGCDKIYVPDGLEANTLGHLTGPEILSVADAPNEVARVPVQYAADQITLYFRDAQVLKTPSSCAIIKTTAAPLLSVGSDVVRYRLVVGDLNET